MRRRSTVVGAVALVVFGLTAVIALAQPPRPGEPMRPGGPGGPGRTSARPPVAWVDVHMHLIGGRGASADYAGAVDAAVREMDQFGIAMAVVMPPPQVDSQSTYDHDAYASALRRYPDRFAFLGGGGTLNPAIHRHADPAKVTDDVKREFAAAAERILDRGAIGFGEIASLHISATTGHPYEFVPADHPLFLVLADVAARRDAVIDLHMDAVDGKTPTPPRFAGGANPPKLPDTLGPLTRLLAHNPKAKIVWAHGASDPIGAMTAATIGRLMDAHANLYVSLRIVGAQAPMENKALGPDGLDPAWKELLIRHADRFVIGTDSFIVSPAVPQRGGRGPGLQFAERNAPKLMATNYFLSLLALDVARKIGRENAARIYKLTVK